jgi:hypothetical protein
MTDLPCCFGPVAMHHVMAGAHGETKPLTSRPGGKREKRKSWGFTVPFEGILPMT